MNPLDGNKRSYDSPVAIPKLPKLYFHNGRFVATFRLWNVRYEYLDQTPELRDVRNRRGPVCVP